MELVAHRGYPQRYPENTLPGIEAALTAGARFVEVDVQLTADRVPVLFHDETLDRVCGVAGFLHERTLADLRKLPASEPGRFGDRFRDVRVPTLEEACAVIGDATLFVEVKPEAVRTFGLREVMARVLPCLHERAVVISYLPEVLEHAPGPTGLVLERWGQPLPECDYVFCNVTKLPKRGALQHGPKLAVYEIVDPDVARALAARGVDLVETFAIGEMLEALR